MPFRHTCSIHVCEVQYSTGFVQTKEGLRCREHDKDEDDEDIGQEGIVALQLRSVETRFIAAFRSVPTCYMLDAGAQDIRCSAW